MFCKGHCLCILLRLSVLSLQVLLAGRKHSGQSVHPKSKNQFLMHKETFEIYDETLAVLDRSHVVRD